MSVITPISSSSKSKGTFLTNEDETPGSRKFKSSIPEETEVYELEAQEDLEIACLHATKGKFGLCFFQANAECLKVSTYDYSDSEPFDLIFQILQVLAPTLVLISSSSSPTIIQKLEKASIAYETRRSADFSSKFAYAKLFSDFELPMNDILYFFSNGQNLLSQMALGGFLKYFEDLLSPTGSTLITSPLSIKSISLLSFENIMFISGCTLESLKVFDFKDHPNSNYTKGREGTSLFSILNFTRSKGGKKLLSQWLRSPSTNIDEINDRLDTIELLLNSNYAGVVFVSSCKKLTGDSLLRSISNSIGKIGNVNLRFFAKGEGGIDSYLEWKKIYEFAVHSVKLKDLICNLMPEFSWSVRNNVDQEFESVKSYYPSLFHDIINEIDSDKLSQIIHGIERIIDFKESEVEERTVVKEGVDKELDQMKSFYQGLEVFLQDIAKRVVSNLSILEPNSVICSKLRGVYFPQLGFLIAIPFTDFEIYLDEISQHEDLFERIFNTEEMVYFKNNLLREVDLEVGDIYHLIVDKEIEILFELQETIVRPCCDSYFNISEFASKLDCLCSLAFAAVSNNYNRPCIVPDNVLLLKNGRHPILEKILIHENSAFFPNNCDIGVKNGKLELQDSQNSPHVVLLTGPNASGKSVYLSQVGLIVLMAHIGSFIPADKGSVIGIQRGMVCKASSVDSGSLNTSSFYQDLNEVTSAFRITKQEQGNNCLVLLDEFGKGTNARNGISLLGAIMKYFCFDSKSICIAATHYHELYLQNLLEPDLEKEIGFYHMETIMESNEESQDLTFLYQVVPGKTMSSYGLLCARIAGIDEALIQRAEEISNDVIKWICPSRAEFYNDKVKKETKIAEKLRDKLKMVEFESITDEDLRKLITELKQTITDK